MTELHPWTAAYLLPPVPEDAPELQRFLLDQAVDRDSGKTTTHSVIPNQVPAEMIVDWRATFPRQNMHTLATRIMAGSEHMNDLAELSHWDWEQAKEQLRLALIRKGPPELRGTTWQTAMSNPFTHVLPRSNQDELSAQNFILIETDGLEIAQAFWDHLGNHPAAYRTAHRLLEDDPDLCLHDALITTRAIWELA